MVEKRRRFLVIDLVCEGRSTDSMSISENERGFQVTASLAEEDVKWLMDAFVDFY